MIKTIKLNVEFKITFNMKGKVDVLEIKEIFNSWNFPYGNDTTEYSLYTEVFIALSESAMGIVIDYFGMDEKKRNDIDIMGIEVQKIEVL